MKATLLSVVVVAVLATGFSHLRRSVPTFSAATLAAANTDLAATEARVASPRKMSSHLNTSFPDSLPFIGFDPAFATALLFQEEYLNRKSTPSQPAQGFTKTDMLETVRTLRELPFYNMEALAEHFDFYCFNSGLPCDKVRVTGYYTPVLDARRKREGAYLYPLLEKAKGTKTEETGSGEAVSRGAGIAGRPLAWVKSQRELANAQLQGSCLVQFPDGEKQFLGFGGSVPHAGSKYVYFTKIDDQVLGAGSFPMTPGYSLAIDPKVAPLGSAILAELPMLDASGHVKGYTYRIVLAQDRGGAIKSAAKVDLYSGIGRKGLESARKINEYGRFWVMLPKR